MKYIGGIYRGGESCLCGKRNKNNSYNHCQWKRSVLDGWIWSEGDLQRYTVGYGCRILKKCANSSRYNWSKEIWSLKVTGSTQLCVWRAMLEKLPTRSNLARRGAIISSNLCPLCKKVEETTQHVFINCEITQKVWDNCDKWIRISSIRHQTVINHF